MSRHPKVPPHGSLTKDDVSRLGAHLTRISFLFPLEYRTEGDFTPIVLTYLAGRVPSAKHERRVLGGRFDFRSGGPNPAFLELAVAPRRLQDPHCNDLEFPGHKEGTQLYASQNRSELKKLSGLPQSKAKGRYLLLVDLRGTFDPKRLRKDYRKALPRGRGHSPVWVVYARLNHPPKAFRVGGR